MSATKAKKTPKSSSSSSSPPTTVSPKATPKPAAKTLFNYFTKLSKDKTENDLNESNRKRKLSTEINQQPPVKILKSSTDEVITIDENLDPAITKPIEIDDDLENITQVEEKKPLLIKLTPISKRKREAKIKNSKRKSKDAKSETLPSTEMEVDDVVESALEKDENVHIDEIKDNIDQKSELIVKIVNLDENSEKDEDKLNSEVSTVEIQKKVIMEEEKSNKNPRRKSTRIENSQEKVSEEIRNNAEAKMAKPETKPKKETKRKSTAHTKTELPSKDEKSDDIKTAESNVPVGKIEIQDSSLNESKSDELLIISDNNSDEGLLDEPADNKNNLSHNLNTSSEKKLTPKQLKLQERRRKAREEKEKKIQDEREKRQKEKEEQRKEREERELKLKKEREEKEEQRKKEKAEKDEQRAKEREEKERKRLEEIQQKNEEKRKRDEQKEDEKRKKEEERKKKEAEKEEEKREKEQERIKKEQDKLEEEQKKKREADKFKRFFRNSVDQTNPITISATSGGSISISSSQGNDASNSATEPSSNFMPFCIKGNMKLAPCTRKTITDDQKVELEKVLEGKEKLEKQNSYLKQLKSQKYVIGKSDKTIPNYEEDEVMIIDDELATIGDEVVELKPKQQKYRAKFFLFNGNRRPPYYGTWRKKSTIVRPCKPFEMDTKYFNYEVDSDEEWEEDEPGESLKGSDDDYESNDDYEVDNEFFVPHGYLSDEENKAEMDGEGADIEENDNHPATQKAKLKILQQEFFAEHNKKTEKIKPKLIGCIWQNLNDDDDSDTYPAIIHKLLENHAMIMDGPIVLKQEVPPVDDNQTESATSIDLTNEEIQILIKLVHGNFHKRQFLVAEYLASRAEKLEAGKKEKLTKVKINNKIREIADWKRCVTDNVIMNNRYCWIVKANHLEQFGLSDLDVFNTWKYTLKPLRTAPTAPPTKEDSNDGATTTITTTAASTPVVNSITKYTTPISKILQKKDISSKPIATSSSTPAATATKKSPTQTKPILATTSTSNSIQPTKKRVKLLMSVPRGQVFPQNKKNTLISEYLNNGKLNNNSSKNNIGKDDNVDNSKITNNTSNPKAVEADEMLSMDCDVIQLD